MLVLRFKNLCSMVAVAQLVEPRIVIPAVAGSNPVSHPIYSNNFSFIFLIYASFLRKLYGFFLLKGPLTCLASCLVLFDITRLLALGIG